MVFSRHDEHEVRGDHVQAQHAREGRVQVHQITQHFLSGKDSHFCSNFNNSQDIFKFSTVQPKQLLYSEHLRIVQTVIIFQIPNNKNVPF